MVIERAYGSWESTVDSEFVVTSGNCITLSEMELDFSDFGKGTVYWSEQKSDGRQVIYSVSTVLDPEKRVISEWTPYPFSANSQAHEYGGGVFCVHAGIVYFVTANGLYRQDNCGNIPDPLTKHNAAYRYADPIFAHDSIYCVREDHSDPTNEAQNTIIRVSPARPKVVKDKDGNNVYTYPKMEVVCEGASFYSTPRVSRSGTKLVWLQWNHPNMPWDSTEIWVADLEVSGAVVANSQRRLLGDGHTNYQQPMWSSLDDLFVIADSTDWWNIHEVDFTGKLKRNIHECAEDVGLPQWQFGSANRVYAFDRDPASNTIVMAMQNVGCGLGYCRNWVTCLLVKDIKTGESHKIQTGFTNHHSVQVGKDRAVYAIADAPDKPQSLIRVELNDKTVQIVREQIDSEIVTKLDISVPQFIKFPTGENNESFASGWFYPPCNAAYNAPKGTLPPVICKAHGGPTGACSSALDWKKQYYTQRGFAIFDVNYRGSTGFGRKYRDVLYGHCGEYDVDDVCNAALHLVKIGLVDVSKLCITGQSAGGYLVLCAVLRANMFKAACSLYGISDVTLLMQETHKFESKYDVFARGRFETEEEKTKLYAELSPVNHLDKIACPVAFFHGSEDKVVPINQAQSMYDAVKAKGFKTALIVFEGEGHGFRKKEHIQQCLDDETGQRLMKLSPPTKIDLRICQIFITTTV